MGTYQLFYLKKPEMAKEVNNLLKEKYNLTYESYNGIEYGIFFTQEMFDEDSRFMNEDEEGKQNLSHYQRPISKETYYLLLFGIGNCFGDIGTFCVKISCIAEEKSIQLKLCRNFQNS
jgi:hypothetical protein